MGKKFERTSFIITLLIMNLDITQNVSFKKVLVFTFDHFIESFGIAHHHLAIAPFVDILKFKFEVIPLKPPNS